MSILSKVFGIWAVSKTVTSTTPLFIRLLIGMAAITVCSVVASIIIIILAVGLTWAAYLQLLQQGISEGSALVIIGSLLLALLAAVVLALKKHVRKLQLVSKNIMHMQAPIGEKISDITGAFMQGFNTPAYTPPHSPKL